MNHELPRLTSLIAWTVFDDRFDGLYHADRGCPGKLIRLMVGFLYLMHIIFVGKLVKVGRPLRQKTDSSKKLYSLHSLEVECISKGKAHKRYKLRVKVSIAVNNRSSFVIGGLALPSNPYYGHTLKSVDNGLFFPRSSG